VFVEELDNVAEGVDGGSPADERVHVPVAGDLGVLDVKPS
jgi:hypothetical protein